MPNNAQRQRSQAAKVARRKAVVASKKMLELASGSLAGRVRTAAKGPVARCVMSATMFELGIGHVIVARSLPSGLLGCAFFLLDTYCLGVKDAFFAELGQSELQSQLAGQDGVQTFVDIELAHARKLVRDAAAYAAGLGLPAAKDTPVVEAIFGGVDPGTCAEIFTFGKDGKPLFVCGPNDTPTRVRSILYSLEKKQGSGQYDYMIDITPDL